MHHRHMEANFKTIVVPLGLERDSDRSIGVAKCLAALGNLPIELVTVSSPHLSDEPDLDGLSQRAAEFRLDRWTPVVLHSNDPAAAIADHLASADQPLVVMATAAHGALGELVSASTSADLLSRTAVPVVAIGPHVPLDWATDRPTLLSCVGPDDESTASLPEMVRWIHTFGGGEPWFLEVLPALTKASSSRGDVRESAHVQRSTQHLQQLGIESEWEVLHGDDPAEAIADFASGVAGAVLVVASERWADASRMHLHSVSRRLAHTAHQPVLVIPHPAGLHD